MKKLLISLLVTLLPLCMFAQVITEVPIQHSFLGKYSFGDKVTQEILCELHNERYYDGCNEYTPVLEGNTKRFTVEKKQIFGNYHWDDVDVYTVNSQMCIISFSNSDYSDEYKKNFDELQSLFVKKYGTPNTTTEDGINVYYWNDKFNKEILLKMEKKIGIFSTEYHYVTLSYSDGNYTKYIVAGIDEI